MKDVSPLPAVLQDPAHQREIVNRMMRRQFSLSLKIAVAFIVFLVGVPLVNRYLPGLASARVAGFTASWLFLAVLFYPITWLLSWIFIRSSDRIEHEMAAELTREVVK